VPLLSKMISREKEDNLVRKLRREGSSHEYSTLETHPITRTKSMEPLPNTW
jgi:hypothetical protein